MQRLTGKLVTASCYNCCTHPFRVYSNFVLVVTLFAATAEFSCWFISVNTDCSFPSTYNIYFSEYGLFIPVHVQHLFPWIRTVHSRPRTTFISVNTDCSFPFTHNIYFSEYGLFIPVHVQRWTVLQLYWERGRRINSWTTSRLSQS